MEHTKISLNNNELVINLFEKTTNQPSKFRTKNSIKVNDNAGWT